MSDIHQLIEMLQSNNPNKRYDACEQLRISQQPISEEAINALRFVIGDSDPDVADAARRALELHNYELTTEEIPKESQHKKHPKKNIFIDRLVYFFIYAAIFALICLGLILVLPSVLGCALGC